MFSKDAIQEVISEYLKRAKETENFIEKNKNLLDILKGNILFSTEELYDIKEEDKAKEIEKIEKLILILENREKQEKEYLESLMKDIEEIRHLGQTQTVMNFHDENNVEQPRNQENETKLIITEMLINNEVKSIHESLEAADTNQLKTVLKGESFVPYGKMSLTELADKFEEEKESLIYCGICDTKEHETLMEKLEPFLSSSIHSTSMAIEAKSIEKNKSNNTDITVST